jgi:uncharacterized membrane protein (UPF0136 family)
MPAVVKKTVRHGIWALAALFLVAGFLGYCTPISQISMPSGVADRTFGQRAIFFWAENGWTLMLIGAGLLLLRVVALPLALD